MTPANIANAVSKLLSIDIRVKSRKIEYVKARALYYHVCRMVSDRWTFATIGEEVNTDHSTAIYGDKMFEENYSIYYPKLQEHADFLINHFRKVKKGEVKEMKEEHDLFISLKSENELLKTEIAFLKQEKKSSLGERIDDLLKIAPHRDLIEERLNAIIHMESKKVYL